MNALELYQLRRYCRKHGLDSQEIDSSLTYWENKEHLVSMVRMLSRFLDTFELARMEDLEKQYIAENALTYYAACSMYGETKSEEVGELDTSPQQFSLKTMTDIGFSLRAMVRRKG